LIETERLLLRKPRVADAADLAVAYSDPEVMRFIGDGSTASLAEIEDEIRQWLERWESWGMSLYSLERRASSSGIPRRGRSPVMRPSSAGCSPGSIGATATRPRLRLRYATGRSASEA